MRVAAIVSLTLSAASLAATTTVANYTFTGNSLASSDTDANSTAADLVVGAGLTSVAQFITYFGGAAYGTYSNNTPATELLAISGNDYFSVTVTPTSGSFSYSALSFNLDCSANNLASSYTANISVRWSVDNFSTTLGTGTSTINVGQTSSSGVGVNLSSSPVQSGPVEFRFYFFDNQNESSFTNIAIDNIMLTGTFHAPPPVYRLIDLGTLGGVQSNATAINNHGQIAGDSTTKSGSTHAFFFASGKITDLGVIAGSESHANGINDNAQVVGQSSVRNGDLHACLFANGKKTDLSVFSGNPNSNSLANAINASGQIVGEANTATGRNAALFSGGAVTNLDPSATVDSEALAINAAGAIVGYTVPVAGQQRAAIFSGGMAQDIGVIGGGSSANAFCTAINTAGIIVGESQVDATPHHDHAFLYDGTMMDLGTLDGGASSNSGATGINNHNQVVGSSDSAGTLHGFLYTSGTMFDLLTLAAGSTSGFTALLPNAINDDGWIVGQGTTPGGQAHAFLAVPVSFTIAPPTAAKGEVVPGISNAVFSVIGPPAIDAAGDIAFRATVKGTSATAGINATNNSGIWFYDSMGGTLIARTGDATMPAPDTNSAVFAKLSDPVLASSGALAFIGKLKVGTGDATAANNTGVWRRQNGTTSLKVRLGDNAPSTAPGSAKITALSEIGIDKRGSLGLLANLKGTPTFVATGSAIFGSDNSGALSLLDRKGADVRSLTAFKPLTGVVGQSRSVDGVNGNVAYLRTDATLGSELVLAMPQTSSMDESVVASVGMTPAALTTALSGATVKSFGEPTVNANGNVAFSLKLGGTGVTAQNNAAIVLASGANFTVTARTHDPAPDKQGTASSAVFTKLGDPVLNNQDRIAFLGTLASSGGVTAVNNTGVWSNADGTMKLIAQKGDDAPGYGGGKFSAFNQIVLPDVGGVVLLATLSGVPGTRNQGVWTVASNGTLASAVREGDTLTVNGDTKTVKSIGIFQIAPGVMGQSRSFDAGTGSLVYQATFTDGTSGVFKITLP